MEVEVTFESAFYNFGTLRVVEASLRRFGACIEYAVDEFVWITTSAVFRTVLLVFGTVAYTIAAEHLADGAVLRAGELVFFFAADAVAAFGFVLAILRAVRGILTILALPISTGGSAGFEASSLIYTLTNWTEKGL